MKTKKYKVCIGIDESYTRTGISVAVNGELVLVNSINFKGCKNKTEKRIEVKRVLEKLIKSIQYKYKGCKINIICERIRTFTGGNKLRPKYLIGTGALIATIVDTAYPYGIKTYTVDTRGWKAQVVGNSKPMKNKIGIDPNKWATILFIIAKGFEKHIMIEVSAAKKKGVFEFKGKRYTYDDDAADSACIALYAFIPKGRRNLREEI